MPHVNWRLYSIVDPALTDPRGLALDTIVRQAAAGGATAIQLRYKTNEARALLAAAQSVRAVTRALGLPFIVNDRIDIALAVGADGVHLGPEDLPVAVARQLLGPEKLVGASTGTVAEAQAALAEGATYLGVGAVFGTRSKADAGDPIGPAGLQAIVQAVPLPVVGIGGITPENVARVIRAGAAGAAVISALLTAPDITVAAHALRAAIDAEL